MCSGCKSEQAYWSCLPSPTKDGVSGPVKALSRRRGKDCTSSYGYLGRSITEITQVVQLVFWRTRFK